MVYWSSRQITVTISRGKPSPPMPIPPPDPPKRFPPPPRRVWRSHGLAEVVLLRLILLAVMGGWLAVGVAAGKLLLTHALGESVGARVSGMRKVDHKGTDYYVMYAFDAGSGDGGRTHFVGEAQVSAQRYRTLAIGSTVPVKTLVIEGERLHELSFSAGESACFPQYFGLLCLGIMSGVILYVVWIVPIRTRRLIRHGAIAEGIVQEVIPQPKNNQQSVKYTFTPAGASWDRRRGSTVAPQKQSALPGQRVTVFYDPQRPRHNVAYEFCEFETDVLPG
jgi:hypothetical protein